MNRQQIANQLKSIPMRGPKWVRDRAIDTVLGNDTTTGVLSKPYTREQKIEFRKRWDEKVEDGIYSGKWAHPHHRCTQCQQLTEIEIDSTGMAWCKSCQWGGVETDYDAMRECVRCRNA